MSATNPQQQYLVAKYLNTLMVTKSKYSTCAIITARVLTSTECLGRKKWRRLKKRQNNKENKKEKGKKKAKEEKQRKAEERKRKLAEKAENARKVAEKKAEEAKK